MKQKKIKLKRAVINAYTAGAGKQLFLLPGWPFSGRSYLPLISILKDIYEVTTIDLPGWAGKSTLATTCNYKVKTYAEIISEFLERKYPQGTKINIGGVSMGGTLSLLTAQKNPKKINKIIVQSSPWNGQKFKKVHKIKTKLITRSKNSPSLQPLMKRVYKNWCLLNHWNRGGRELKKLLLKDYKNLNPSAVITFADDFFKKNYEKVFKKIKKPVTAIGCTKDKYVSSEQMNFLSAKILSKAKYYEVPYSHFFLVENPKLMADIIKENI